jgi:hypothetical protein
MAKLLCSCNIPEPEPPGGDGTAAKYLMWCFGVVCAQLIRQLDGESTFVESLERHLKAPVGCVAELSVGLPQAGVAASVSNNYSGMLQQIAQQQQQQPSEEAEQNHKDMFGVGAGSNSRLAAHLVKDPGSLNRSWLRDMSVPGFNMFGSARTVCRIFDKTFCSSETTPLISPSRVDQIGAVYAAEETGLFGTQSWGLGLQVYQLTKSKAPPTKVVGHHAFGGSFAFSVPAQKVSCVVLVNELSLDRSVARQTIELVCKKLDLGNSDEMFRGMF